MVHGAPKLDRIDIRILSHLQKNGRATNVELAEAVGLSASPCTARVKRLEKAGYITGYSAQVQLQKLGSTVIIYTQITLADHRSQDFSRFESRVRQMSEVTECYLVSGGYDYLIKFVAFSIQHYQETMERMLAMNIGVEKYFSYVVMKPVFVKQHHDLEGFLNRTE
ncbi:Lrp/AsnC family transcriptional regulator [Teichococcus aestuarii]